MMGVHVADGARKHVGSKIDYRNVNVHVAQDIKLRNKAARSKELIRRAG